MPPCEGGRTQAGVKKSFSTIDVSTIWILQGNDISGKNRQERKMVIARN